MRGAVVADFARIPRCCRVLLRTPPEMNLLEQVHTSYVHTRRASVLRDHLTEVLPKTATVLDVGCGDGLISYLMMQKRPDIKIKGVDILQRSQTQIPVEW